MLAIDISALEYNFIIWFQSIGNPFFDGLQNLNSFLGEEFAVIVILGFLYWCYDKETGAFLSLSLFASASVNGILKNSIKRMRPYESEEFLIQNKRPLDKYSYSYPSGHAQLSATLYGGIALKYRKKWLIITAAVICFLVAQSRVYLGSHFPSDVLGGLAVGLLITLLIRELFAAVNNRYIVYGSLIAVSAAGLFFADTADYFTSFGMLAGAMGGIIFEKRFVGFSETRIWWRAGIRLAVGLGLFAGLRAALKSLLGLIDADSLWLDCLRYALVTFFGFGVYPLFFKLGDKILVKFNKKASV